MANTLNGVRRFRIGLICIAYLVLASCLSAQTQQAGKSSASPQPATSETAKAPEPSPADSALQREYARLAQLLNSTDTHGRREAADTLLRVRPNDVANPETRKLIARGYRAVAMEDRLGQESAIRGLVIWGGKFSVPILIELMEKERTRVPEEIFEGLASLKDPQGAEAVARYLGNFFNNDAAVSALRRMGSVAEDAVMKAAPSNDPKVSLAAVHLLGDVGSDKSLPILQRAMQSRNAEIKFAARESTKRIRERKSAGDSVDKSTGDEAGSPFSATAGPAVDITARNTSSGLSVPRTPRGLPGNSDAPFDEKEESPVFEGDWSKVTPLLPGEPAGAGVAADPEPLSEDSKFRPQPVRLTNNDGGHERPVALAVAATKPIAAVIYGDPFKASLGRLEIVNLQQRKALGSSNILGGAKFCRLSPGGARLLVASEDGTRDRKLRLNVYSPETGKATEQTIWWPYSSGEHWQNQISAMEWLDEERMLTLNGEGMLVMWRIDGKTPRASYQIDGARSGGLALSGGRAHFAISTPRGVEIFRASDGELLARMKDSRMSSAVLAFSPNGNQLAAVSGKWICVWDIKTGELKRDFDCMNLAGSSSLTWLDNRYLLVDGKDVVDVERRLLVWRYEVESQLSLHDGDWLWSVMSIGNARGLMPNQLLNEKVTNASASLDAESILALKPGAKVSLDISLGGEDQAKAKKSLRAALEKNGVVVADNQPLRVRAQVVSGRSTTQEYGRFAFSGDRETVTLTERLYEVELTLDGQSLWKYATHIQSASGPIHLRTQKGETAQQAVDRANQQQTSGFAYGVSRFPSHVVHPKYSGPLGTSKLTAAGVE